MDRSEREYHELVARFRSLPGGRDPHGWATGELAGCEERLLRHVRARDAHGRDALGVLLWDAERRLISFIAAQLRKHGQRDRDQAEDLAQQVLAAVLSAYDHGRGLHLEHGAKSFYEYLYLTARREVVHYTKRSAKTREVLTDPAELPPAPAGADLAPAAADYPFGSQEFRFWVDQATRHLPARDFNLVFLAEYEGLTDAELAEAVGLPAGANISMYKKRAREKFIDWFAVLWVARTMRAAAGGPADGRCAVLGQLLAGWDAHDPASFTAGSYTMVRRHIGPCAVCRPVLADFKRTKTGSRQATMSSKLLAAFRALPLVPVLPALQRWLDEQETGDGHRGRTVADILASLRSPAPTPAAADGAGEAAGETGAGSAAMPGGAAVVPSAGPLLPAAAAAARDNDGRPLVVRLVTRSLAGPARLARRAGERVRAAAVSVTRLPVVSGLTQAIQDNPLAAIVTGAVAVAVTGALIAASLPHATNSATRHSARPAITTTAPASAGPAAAPVAAGTQPIQVAQPSQPPAAPAGHSGMPRADVSAASTGTGSPTPAPSPAPSPTPTPTGTATGPVNITVDPTQLSALSWGFARVTGWLDTHKIYNLRLLPGNYTLVTSGNTHGVVTVTPAGTIDYDPALTYLSGRGTATLTILGLPVTVDPTRLSALGWGFAWVTGWLDTHKIYNLRLLPGSYRFKAPGAALDFVFTVTAAGTVDYDPALTYLSGRGTATLTVG